MERIDPRAPGAENNGEIFITGRIIRISNALALQHLNRHGLVVKGQYYVFDLDTQFH